MTHTLDQLRRTLHQHAADAERAAPSPVQRSHAVTRRAAGRRRQRRVGLVSAVGLAGAAAVAAMVVAGPGRDTAPAPSAPSTPRTPTPSATLDPPLDEMVAGVRYPGTLEVAGAPYWLGSSYTPDPGRRRAVVEIGAFDVPLVLAWSTTPGTRGVVTVRVDGTVRSRSAAGGLKTGLSLSPGEEHRVVVTAPALRPGQQIGFATYARPPA